MSITEGIVKGSEQKLSRAMFKIAVELGALTHMLAAINDIDDETLFKLRAMCTDERNKRRAVNPTPSRGGKTDKPGT